MKTKMKTVMVLLVAMAVIGFAASSVSAQTYVAAYAKGGVDVCDKEDSDMNNGALYVECDAVGYGYSWGDAWGNGVPHYTDSDGWHNDCWSDAYASNGYALTHAGCDA